MRQILHFTAGVAATVAIMPFFALQDARLPPSAFATRTASVQLQIDGALKGIQRADNGLFFVDGSMGSESVRFLVDTGASHMVLSHEAAQKIDSYARLADTEKLLTAGGVVDVDWIVIKEIAFDGHVMKNLKAAIPRKDVGVSLLGQNGLAQFASIHIDGDHLTFRGPSPALAKKVQPEND